MAVRPRHSGAGMGPARGASSLQSQSFWRPGRARSFGVGRWGARSASVPLLADRARSKLPRLDGRTVSMARVPALCARFHAPRGTGAIIGLAPALFV